MHRHGHHLAVYRTRFWVCLALTVPILVVSPMPAMLLGLPHLAFPGDTWFLFGVATVIFVYGGWPFFGGARSELAMRMPGMMTLVTVGITTAYAYSAAVAFGLEGEPVYWELATLVDVMLLGHWIEMRSVMSAGSAVEAIAALVPGRAHLVEPDGAERDVDTSSLVPGDVIVVRAMERIPADGEVVSGESSVDESLLTGESVPVLRSEGDEVVGGSDNGSGTLTVRVTRSGEEGFVSQVLELVRAAQESSSHTQRLADRAAGWLTYVALGAGAITLVVWLLLRAPLALALEHAVTVVVIACPHALGLAIPLVVAVSTSLAARAGVLIRDRNGFERGHELDTMVFDKTGTLTEGRFGVDRVRAFADGWDEARVLAWAAAVERGSEHPIARAIEEAGSTTRFELSVSGFEAMPGQGVRARVEGVPVEVVSPREVGARGLSLPDDADKDDRAATTVVVLAEGAPVGSIALADRVRESSAVAVTRLAAMGVDAVMITGDSPAVADAVASTVGIERVIAGVRPEDKADEIQRLIAEGHRVGMTGDGVNDAPALAAATMGIAVGAGTDVAKQTADVVLVRSDPADVVDAVELSRRTWRKMRQNLFWATGYNVVAIPLAAGVLAFAGIVLTPAAGAALMAVSTVIVAINARLLRMPKER